MMDDISTTLPPPKVVHLSSIIHACGLVGICGGSLVGLWGISCGLVARSLSVQLVLKNSGSGPPRTLGDQLVQVIKQDGGWCNTIVYWFYFDAP